MANHLIKIILMGQLSFLLGEVHKYEYINMTKTWEDAKNYCQQNFTDLATVPNARFMKKLNETNEEEAWIGLSSKPFGNQMWRWVQLELMDDNPVWANNWNDTENCARLNTSNTPGLKDAKCDRLYSFVCYDCNNDTLYHNDAEVSWPAAREHCRKNNTELAGGHRQFNETRTKLKNKTIWVGLFRDTWGWSDNSDSSYRNWETFSEETKTEWTSNDSCTVTQNSGKWKPTNCNTTKPFICYKENVKLEMRNLTWNEAFDYCKTNYSGLVSIVTRDDELWIQEKARQATTEYIWLGLQYSCPLDLWFWLNDMVSDENLMENGKRTCDTVVAMSRKGKYKMVQKYDNDKYNFVCTVAN